MKTLRLLTVALSTLALACAGEYTGSGTGGGGGDGTGGGGGDGTGGGGGDGTGGGGGGGGGGGAGTVSGDITASATWTGTVSVSAPATIKSGATITVSAGAIIEFAMDASLTVEGVLDVQGADGSLVTFKPATGVTRWGGITAASGGSVTVAWADLSGAARGLTCATGAAGCVIEDSHYHDNIAVADFKAAGAISRSIMETNGQITFGTGSDVTITDTAFTGQSGDLLIMSGGRLEVLYSEIGATSSTEHCGFHINSAQYAKVDHSVIHEQPYGFMIGGVTGAIITHNNFLANGTDIDDMGGTSAIDATGNYWDGGAPTITGYNTSGSSGAMLTDVGPR